MAGSAIYFSLPNSKFVCLCVYRVPSYGSVHCLLCLSWSHLSESSSSGVFAYSRKNLPGSKATLGTQFCRSGVMKPVMQHRSTPLLIGGMGWILRHLFSSCPPSMPVHVYHHSTQLISNSSRSQSHSHALCGYDFHDDTGVAPAQC